MPGRNAIERIIDAIIKTDGIALLEVQIEGKVIRFVTQPKEAPPEDEVDNWINAHGQD